MDRYDVIIVGGGLAGLTAALHLEREGRQVHVFEKQQYPRHKVCGEYVSNEVKPYLNSLGISFSKAVDINTLQLSTVNGKVINTELPLGGMGISRYALDDMLYKKAIDANIPFTFEAVKTIDFANDIFTVKTDSEAAYSAPIVIGAYGKRSNLDKQLNRNFIERKSPWLGVKAHYHHDNFPDNVVALHNFNGGYGGLSKIETGGINFCYLATYESFRKEKDINSFNINVVSKNPFLRNFLDNAKPIFDHPMTIAQISFEKKKAVENHILMCGDTAGLIHPLCGNGMAMAIHSARIASEHILNYLKNKNFDRKSMENAYTSEWKTTFEKRLSMGRRLQSVLMKPKLSGVLLSTVAKSPWLLKKLIKGTHGKPISG